jgi:hypothetical protein
VDCDRKKPNCLGCFFQSWLSCLLRPSQFLDKQRWKGGVFQRKKKPPGKKNKGRDSAWLSWSES